MFDNVRKKISSFFSNKNKGIVALASVLVFIVSLCFISFATKINVVTYLTERILKELGIYTSEVKNDVLESSGYSSLLPSSWHIDRNVKWTDYKTAEISYDLKSVVKTDSNYKDIMLVINVSSEMESGKLERLKRELKNLVNSILADSHNRVSLIGLNLTSNIEVNFTSDKGLLTNNITNITGDNKTNYNEALLSVDSVMKSYVKEDNREVVTVFVTDSYPSIDSPNQVGTYEVLKDKYPYMKINGVQYEMGKNVVKEIDDITDSVFLANQTTLYNTLLSASVLIVPYEKFVVTDYVDNSYFSVNSIDDISVSVGNVSLTSVDGTQNIIWDLGDNSFRIGSNAKMVVKLSLKDGSSGYVPLNKKWKVETKLKDESIYEVSSSDPLVLKSDYNVIYYTNVPEGCSLDTIPQESYSPYQNVTIKQDKLECYGYIFKGWQIDREDLKDISRVNNDVFIMPEHDVKIRATWAKQSIHKSTYGTVKPKPTLYSVIENQSLTSPLVEEYDNRSYSDTMDGMGYEKIYHYHATSYDDLIEIQNMNNVIFAGHCWQIIRTTDTGGVKLIYNGEPTSDGRCSNDRENHAGYNGSTSVMLGDSIYYYGTSYTYDKASKTFSLAGDLVQKKWDESIGPSLVGKYTCKNYMQDGTCDTLYYVMSYESSMSANALILDSTADYSQVGNVAYNEKTDSPAYVGYMYNKVYEPKVLDTTMVPRMDLAVNTDMGREVSNDSESPYQFDFSNNKWMSTNHTDDSVSAIEISVYSNEYYLSYEISSEANDVANIYVDGVLKETLSGESSSQIYLGYLSDSSVIKVEYIKNSSISSGDDQIRFALLRRNNYVTSDKLYYGKNVQYKNGKYYIDNPINIDLTTNYEQLNNYHYVCSGESISMIDNTVLCSEVKYVFYYEEYNDVFYYIDLKDGVTIEDAIREMLSSDDVNKVDSTIKTAVDAWYQRYLLEYDDYLEDVIFCNNREIRMLNGWDPNGGNISSVLWFIISRESEDFPAGAIISKNFYLSCSNETDKFSVSNPKAKLKYKVGLPTYGEMRPDYDETFSFGGNSYWLSSPVSYVSYFGHENSAIVMAVTPYRNFVDASEVDYFMGVRPSVSLKPETSFIRGDGSMDNPYVVGE